VERRSYNYAIRVAIESRVLSFGRAHRPLYSALKDEYEPLSRSSVNSYWQALELVLALSTQNKGLVGYVEL
jgi:hypothetical protein